MPVFISRFRSDQTFFYRAPQAKATNRAVLVRWAVNSGQVYFNVLASKKRLVAAEQQDNAVTIQIIKAAGLQYYDPALAQARVGVARDPLVEAQEFVRLAEMALRRADGAVC
jgi:outer membrane protein TolC